MVKNREEMFATFLKSERSWWVELDESLNVLWMNKKGLKTLEYSEADIGSSIIKSFHNLDKRKLEYASNKTKETGKVVPFVAKVKDKSRKYQNVKFKIKYIKEEHKFYAVGKEFKRRFDLKLQLEQYSNNLFSVNQSLEKISFGLMGLQNITSAVYQSFEEQVEALLGFGMKSFGAELVKVSSIKSNNFDIDFKLPKSTNSFNKSYALEDTCCFESYINKKSVYCKSIESSKSYRNSSILNSLNVVSFVSAPLLEKVNVVGTLCFYFENEVSLGNNDLHLLTILASMVSRTISLDRSEKKIIASNKKLEEKNAELDKFAFTVSHDLKAPLRAVKSLVGWIEDDLEEKLEGDVKESFTMLTGRVDKMEQLIYDILDYSRAGNDKVADEVISLREIIDEVCFENESFPDRNIVFDKSFEEIKVTNKRVFLYQALSNIISNAVKYNDKEETKVRISVEKKDDFVHISVADNGPGIPDKYRSKVFQVFQTIHTKRKDNSTGIGLSIVQKIVTAMGGEVSIKDTDLGGACFEFTMSF